ncbi:MAG: HAMP domain-containing histidine kinase [Pedobacter sp.]|nr:MAG: HAMP domain-containing histidine kinase [Pedobacter sp.]
MLLIFVVVLLILYYRRNLEKKIINVLLQNRTKEIAEANEELGSLNDELTAQMDLVSLQNTELEKLNAVKNKFFSIVSHDLRSPLNTLKMLFELYRKGDLTEDEFSGVLIKLEDTIYTTATFLDNLLEWSKSQLEGMVVKPSIVSVDQVINDNIKLMESQIRLKELNVTSSINSEALVFADPDMLNVVIRNLLSNAIKFCNPKDTVTFKSDKVDDKLIVSVIDSGPGMSEHNVENLFNLSHTVSTGTSGEKGYHLGLILCKDMITQNKGNIVLESTLGKGTAFHITLPTVSP